MTECDIFDQLNLEVKVNSTELKFRLFGFQRTIKIPIDCFIGLNGYEEMTFDFEGNEDLKHMQKQIQAAYPDKKLEQSFNAYLMNKEYEMTDCIVEFSLQHKLIFVAGLNKLLLDRDNF